MNMAPTAAGRANQKARTRAALLRAATELVREGRPPSIPEVADRALISVATAYRYFPSAEELWFEASTEAVGFEPALLATYERIEAAGDDPVERLEALVRSVGFTMLDDQAPYRRLAKGALDQWFSQVETPVEDRAPMRQGRRNEHIAKVVEPLRGRISDDHVDRVAHALGVVVGTDAMLALTDSVGLEGDEAKQAMLDAARWLLTGALAELDPVDRQPGRGRSAKKPRRGV
jgi:AcrR family transcriptional regulator